MAFPINLDATSPGTADTPLPTQISRITGWLEDLFGLPNLTNITGAILSLGALTDGKVATDTVVKASTPFKRLIGTEASAKDFRWVESAGSLLFQVNTGTEAVPVWTTVYSFAFGANFGALWTHTLTASRTYTLPDRTMTVGDAADDPASILTAKGDLMGRSATVPVRVAVGADAQFLKADSTQASGVGYSTVPGAISAAGTLVSSGSGVNYSTTSATFVDVDATNLKASVTVPTGAKFLFVMVTFSTPGSVITDGLNHVQILAAGTATAPGIYVNNTTKNPQGTYTLYGVVTNPTAGAQTIALQFRGDGVNAFGINDAGAEGIDLLRVRMLYVVTF